ncbi:MAG TPA: hypothetical protein VGF12_07075 [Roseateles sp.]|uniref:hypothetical protein n=1 Tax=Roseateles sp. TaxID=1971397 RepID=UPI002ED7D3D2
MTAAVDLCKAFNAGALAQALALLPAKLDSLEARVTLLAIGLQESGLKDRVQVVAGGGQGPARGLLQFELGGGVRGVLNHAASKTLALQVCSARRVPASTASVVWGELSRDDVLAFAFGRLLLLTDPKPLPALGDEQGAWGYYQRCWRPGKPHPSRWPANYQAALDAIRV